MESTVDVVGFCRQCGSVVLLSGDFPVDNSGRVDYDWECENCGSTVELFQEC